MTAVIIPAHNESTGIATCLETLLVEADAGEFRVVVASNGSSDDTAEQARSWVRRTNPPCDVTVLELDVASKTGALNAAIAIASDGPHIILDADVRLPTASAREIARALRQPGVFAASTTLDVDTSHASILSRSYHRYWSRVPSVESGLAGRGVYGLSPEGLTRLGEFPPIIADDRLIDVLFGPDERQRTQATSTVEATRTARALLARKVRVFAGNNELVSAAERHGFELKTSVSGSWLTVVTRDPRSVVDLPAYLAINVLAKVRARLASRRGQVGWNQDRSSR